MFSLGVVVPSSVSHVFSRSRVGRIAIRLLDRFSAPAIWGEQLVRALFLSFRRIVLGTESILFRCAALLRHLRFWFSRRHVFFFCFRFSQSSGSLPCVQPRHFCRRAPLRHLRPAATSTPNHAMQPTTGRREDKFPVTQPLPLQPTRALASGG